MTTFDNIEKIEVEKIRIMVQRKLSKYELAGLHFMEVGKFVDQLTDSVVLNFHAFCLGESQKPIKLKPYPKSWWQMFKRDVMPKWFIRLWPVEFEEYLVDAKVLYPDLKISIPANDSRAIVIINKSPAFIA